MHKHAHARGVRGHAPPEKVLKIRCSAITSEAILVLSSTRVYGGSNTAIRHDTCQLSQGV